MAQVYSLRWNNHQPNFISMFNTLLRTNTLVDCTLAADGQKLQAHKVVLSACSTYFQALFIENPSRHPIIILENISFEDLQTMVEFMYFGEVKLTEKQLPKVLEIAHIFKIKGLTDMQAPMQTQPVFNSNMAPQNNSDLIAKAASSTSPCSTKSSLESTAVQVVTDETSQDRLVIDPLRNGCALNIESPNKLFYSNADTLQQRATDFQGQENLNVQAASRDTQPGHHYAPHGHSQGPPWKRPKQTNSPYAAPDTTQVSPRAGAGAVVRSKRRRPPRGAPPPQSEEKFQRALEAVRTGGIGFCRAAKLFGVNNRTLWLEFRRRGYANARPSIKARVKKDHTAPPAHSAPQLLLQDRQVVVQYTPHALPVGFIDSRAIEFPMHSAPQAPHAHPVNLLNVNFNMMQ